MKPNKLNNHSSVSRSTSTIRILSFLSLVRFLSRQLPLFLLASVFLIPVQVAATDTVVRVGVYNNPPLVSQDSDQKISGLSIDVLQAVAEREDWQLQFVSGSWKECLQRLTEGSIDLQVAIGFSEKRQQHFDFSRETLISNWGRLFRRPGSALDSILDLEDKDIGVLQGDIHATVFQEMVEKFNSKVRLIQLDSYEKIFQQIQAGTIDGGVVNRLYAMQNQHRFKVEATPLIFNPIEIRYAVPKGTNQNLLQAIDHHLAALKKDNNSLYYQSLQRWFNGQQSQPLLPTWFKVTLLGGALLILAISIVALLLKVQVQRRTAELVHRNQQLSENRQHLEQEIVQRKSAERSLQISLESLRKSEARYASLFTNNHTVMLLIDPEDGAIKEANPAACNYYGYSCEELQAMNIAEINILSEQEIRREMERAKQQKTKSFLFKHRLKNGEIRNVEVFSGPNEIDDRILLCSVIHDVTARIAAEKEVRKSKDQWERTFNSFTDIVTLQDSSMRIIKINRAGCDLLGLPREELIGRHCYELFQSIDAPCPNCPILKTQKTFHPYSCEMYNERVGKTFLVSATSVMDAQGEMEYIAHVAKDISQWKKMEQQLFLTEKMTTIASLAAGVAHEINTPLSAVLQSLELVQRGLDPDNKSNRETATRHNVSLDNLQEYLAEKELGYFIDGARQSALNAGEIIKHLLEFSRPRTEQVRPVDLQEVIHTTLQLARADYALKKEYNILNVDIVEEFSPDLGLVPCVRMEIEQVLLNLIKNAIQAMAVEGTEENPRLTLRTKNVGNTAHIEVEDNGPGMEEEVKMRIFDPFFTTKDVGKGTGLGLTVSYAIIHDKHLGRIEVSSSPGRGTTFTVILPLRTGEKAGAAEV